MRFLLPLLMYLLLYQSFGQELIYSATNVHEGNGMIINWEVGSYISDLSNKNVYLRSGSLYEIVATDEVPEDSVDFLLYPNPTAGILYVRSEELSAVSLMDASGKVLFKEERDHQTEVTIDLSKLRAGNYFLYLDVEGRVLKRKIIKY